MFYDDVSHNRVFFESSFGFLKMDIFKNVQNRKPKKSFEKSLLLKIYYYTYIYIYDDK